MYMYACISTREINGATVLSTTSLSLSLSLALSRTLSLLPQQKKAQTKLILITEIHTYIYIHINRERNTEGALCPRKINTRIKLFHLELKRFNLFFRSKCMDPREEISLPMSSPYFMQMGMSGSGPGQQGSFPNRSITSMLNASYQSNMGPNSFVSTLPPEPSSVISPPVVNVAPAAAEVVKRRRGRPRKYGPVGGPNTRPNSLELSPASARSLGSTMSGKRGRGRPPGSGRKQQSASLGDWQSGSAGTSFTPHVLTIAGGEDIATKITSFSQQSSRGICVISASGAVSTVTLQQPSTSGGTVTYEGRFEILCLSGSYLLGDEGGPHGRTGGLSVSLCSPDGRVVGGGVGGALIAAGHVQVIVGSFLLGNSKTKSKAKEYPNCAVELDHSTAGNDAIAPASFARSQNLSPSSSIGVWHSTQQMDLQHAHMDIDLMRE